MGVPSDAVEDIHPKHQKSLSAIARNPLRDWIIVLIHGINSITVCVIDTQNNSRLLGLLLASAGPAGWVRKWGGD